MKLIPVAIPALLLMAGAAQAPAQAPAAASGAAASNDAPELGDVIIKSSVTNIIAPTLVTDRAGNIIDGLQPSQFHLFDNGKEQNIHVDVAFQPISVVVAIEDSSRVEALLPAMRHLGTLMPIIMGDKGEAAVLAFDSRLRVLQDFTANPDKIKVAINKIEAGNSSVRMIDAVDRAVYMLRRRPVDNRKIVLLVSETRDVASEGKVRESLIDAQLSNVLIYTVNISHLAVALTDQPEPPRPDPIAITAQQGVMGNAPTPTSDLQNYGPAQAQFTPLLQEIYKDTKRIFIEDPSEVFTKGTGGAQFSFIKERALEDAVQRIGVEIRSQYLISYKPNDAGEPGFHSIAVTVDSPNAIAKTRPGYWLGGGAQ